MAFFQNSCQNLALVGWCLGGGGSLGGGWRFGAGGGGRALGGGWPCVLCVVFDLLFCVLTKYFFRVFALFLCCLRSLLSAAVSSGEFFPLFLLLAWLAVAFFRSGLLCTAELRFSNRFPGPSSHIAGMCSCKARRIVEDLRSSWIFNFALFWSGLLCTAQFRFSQLRTCSKNLTFYLRVL